MINPDDMILLPPSADERAAGVPHDHLLGQFRCPECGTWVASDTVDGVPQSWKATSNEIDEHGIDPEHAWITDLMPSVKIAATHTRTYPFDQRGKQCKGWHGFYRNGRWTK